MVSYPEVHIRHTYIANIDTVAGLVVFTELFAKPLFRPRHRVQPVFAGKPDTFAVGNAGDIFKSRTVVIVAPY